ncbi:hypothetical protein [Actinokineospora sp. NPDC004072]
MDDTYRQKRPGIAAAGFLAAVGLLALTVLAFRADLVAGWRGGEYATLFLGVAMGSLLLGAGLRLGRPRWASFGSGLLIGGALGVVSAIAVVVAIAVAWSRM